MSKENKEKQIYSGDSIASKWLSGTWLGNLLGYPSNTYIDGYGTTRNYANLGESAQGQQLSRMKDTAKNYGKVALTGMSFGNPLVARSTIGAVLPTGAQSYFITEGLRDAYNRFMKKDKTAEDAVWTGLDLAGAIPAVGSVVRNGKYVFPEIKNNLNKQARIFARQYSDYQPTTQLWNLSEPSPKPFIYLWNADLPEISIKKVGQYEDAITDGLLDSYTLLHNKSIQKAIDSNSKTIQKNRKIKIAEPLESYNKFGKWPGTILFDSIGGASVAKTHVNYDSNLNSYIFTPKIDDKTVAITFDPLKISPRQSREIAFHEGIHTKSLGIGNPRNLGNNMKKVLGKENVEKVFSERKPYAWRLEEIAPFSLANFVKFHKILPGQQMPKNQNNWKVFWDSIKNFNSEEFGAKAYKNFITPILENRKELIKTNNLSALNEQQETLWRLFNGTGY